MLDMLMTLMFWGAGIAAVFTLSQGLRARF